MEKIYRVFVSSTYEDLREERSEVQKALLKLGCLPIGMELFPSTDDETWDFIMRQIDEADYYILVVGGRYGSLAADGVGFTEKEYDYAKKTGKATVAFVHGARGEIPAARTELDSEKRVKLEAFIAKVRSGPLVQSFKTPHELAGQVVISMLDLMRRKPAVGFVRADQATDPKKYANLLEENASLREKLASILSRSSGELFVGNDETLSLAVSYRVQNSDVKSMEIIVTWSVIFEIVANIIIDNPGVSDWRVSNEIASQLLNQKEGDVDAGLDGNIFQDIKKFLFAKQLVEFDIAETVSQSPIMRRISRHIWRLTEYGGKQFGLLFSRK